MLITQREGKAWKTSSDKNAREKWRKNKSNVSTSLLRVPRRKVSA